MSNLYIDNYSTVSQYCHAIPPILTGLKRKCGSSSPSNRLAAQKLFDIQQLKLHCKTFKWLHSMMHLCLCSRSNSLSPPAITLVTPLHLSIAMLLEQGSLTVERGWLLSSKTSVSVDSLPQWMGQVPLKSVVIERVSTK